MNIATLHLFHLLRGCDFVNDNYCENASYPVIQETTNENSPAFNILLE